MFAPIAAVVLAASTAAASPMPPAASSPAARAASTLGTVYTDDVTFSSGQTMTWRVIFSAEGQVAAIGSSG